MCLCGGGGHSGWGRLPVHHEEAVGFGTGATQPPARTPTHFRRSSDLWAPSQESRWARCRLFLVPKKYHHNISPPPPPPGHSHGISGPDSLYQHIISPALVCRVRKSWPAGSGGSFLPRLKKMAKARLISTESKQAAGHPEPTFLHGFPWPGRTGDAEELCFLQTWSHQNSH